MSLVLTRMQNLRSSTNIDKNEYRASRYGALDAFKAMSNDPDSIVTQEMKDKVNQSNGRVFEVPVIDYDGAITIGSERTLEITDSENTSKMVTINFVTYAWGFTMVPVMYQNNEIGAQRDFNTKMMKYIYKLGEKMDTDALAQLATVKSKVINDPLIYDKTGNVINVNWKDRENILSDLEPIFSANDYYGPVHIVGNTGIQSLLNKLNQKGEYNAVNKRLEFSGKSFGFTNRLTNEDDQFASGYAISGSQLGMLARFERECLARTKTNLSYEWDITTLPVLDIPVGTYYYQSVGDYNAIGGDATKDMKRNLKEHFGFAVDVAYITAYNSDANTRPSPYLKFQIAKETVEDYKKVVVSNPEDKPIPTKAVTAGA